MWFRREGQRAAPGEQLHRHGTGGHREESRPGGPAGGLLALAAESGAAALPQVQHLGAEERLDRSLRPEGSGAISHPGRFGGGGGVELAESDRGFLLVSTK